ncbi:MAG: 6-phosphogluconolactonase [Verrucomicrobiae bacterium]|nr:6-phosphogluconolactonase [Verrucomicrobiae bacterium]MCX7723001.1 6-phosphogluconolactonase [Verrucomicrobiae bacterium]MDW7979702.1 6-phosphogluconolactonase [Verrucomicrobiales bacterium]
MQEKKSDLAGRFELLAFPNVEQLADEAAEAWLEEIERAWDAGRPHMVALLGGRVAPRLFSAVVRACAMRGTAFGHVHFFWSDERCVPASDPESNYGLAARWLFEPLGIDMSQIHRIPIELGPVAAAAEAEAELRRVAPIGPCGQPVLDLVLLGMGEDGHIASLFPGEPAELAHAADVFRAVTGPKPPFSRITMSYAVLASARAAWVLVAGAGKCGALRASLQQSGYTPLAKLVRQRGATRIYAELRALVGAA